MSLFNLHILPCNCIFVLVVSLSGMWLVCHWREDQEKIVAYHTNNCNGRKKKVDVKTSSQKLDLSN